MEIFSIWERFMIDGNAHMEIGMNIIHDVKPRNETYEPYEVV